MQEFYRKINIQHRQINDLSQQYLCNADTINSLSFHEFIIISDKYVPTKSYVLYEFVLFCWKLNETRCAHACHTITKSECMRCLCNMPVLLSISVSSFLLLFLVSCEQNIHTNRVCEQTQSSTIRMKRPLK